MAWSEPSRPLQPHELLDDGFAPDPCDLLVIGCGNILRGDDAVGPTLIRELFTRGVPEGVRLVDGGTSGMDVAFGMRGAARVVIVDASATGAAPGTTYRVPAEELGALPPMDGLHSHNFRWDHALSFGDWLLGPQMPTDITVFLIEAASLEPGANLSAPVADAMEKVADMIVVDFFPRPGTVEAADPGGRVLREEVTPMETVDTVEINEAGYLHLPHDLATRRFASDCLVARAEASELILMPLVSPANGGLVLRQRNAAGDRTVLIHEVLGFEHRAGTFPARWDEDRAALIVEVQR